MVGKKEKSVAKTNTYEIRATQRKSRRDETLVFEGTSQELQDKAQAMGSDGYKNVRFRRLSRHELAKLPAAKQCA